MHKKFDFPQEHSFDLKRHLFLAVLSWFSRCYYLQNLKCFCG